MNDDIINEIALFEVKRLLMRHIFNMFYFSILLHTTFPPEWCDG